MGQEVQQRMFHNESSQSVQKPPQLENVFWGFTHTNGHSEGVTSASVCFRRDSTLLHTRQNGPRCDELWIRRRAKPAAQCQSGNAEERGAKSG